MAAATQQTALFDEVSANADNVFSEGLLGIVARQEAQLKEIQWILDTAGVACWCDDKMLTIPERVRLAVGR